MTANSVAQLVGPPDERRQLVPPPDIEHIGLGSPLALAMSSRALGVVLRHEGRPHVAQRVALDAIGAVQATGLAALAQRAVLTRTLFKKLTKSTT